MQNHNEQKHACVARKEVDQPRYIITIALYIYFHDPIFDTFSVFQSAW